MIILNNNKNLVASAKSPFFIGQIHQILCTGIFMNCLCTKVASDSNFQMSKQPPSPQVIIKLVNESTFRRAILKLEIIKIRKFNRKFTYKWIGHAKEENCVVDFHFEYPKVLWKHHSKLKGNTIRRAPQSNERHPDGLKNNYEWLIWSININTNPKTRQFPDNCLTTIWLFCPLTQSEISSVLKEQWPRPRLNICAHPKLQCRLRLVPQ